ncbi:MAG: ABC transporter permease [Oceanipulchritudo sp.]
MMESLSRDLRFGLRQLLKNPAFSLVAILALGLGIGTVTTQLSVVNGLFLKGLPFPDPERIMHLERINIERENLNAEVPIPEFVEWQRRQDAFEGLAGYYSGTANLTFGDKVERYNGCFISGNAFQLLRAQARIGRTLLPEDDLPDSADVIVLSSKVWQGDFAGDPDIVGKSAVLNGRSVTIVGVMPDGFAFPVNEEIWIPLFKQQDPSGMEWGGADVISLEVMGRLKPGVSREAARASMNLVARVLEQQHPDTREGFRDIRVQPFLDEYLGGETVAMTAVMLLITFLILLIACANVANLLLARSMRRQKEVAIRSALGASRNRIISQFLTESVLLAVLGAVVGVLYSIWTVRDLNRTMAGMDQPFWIDFSLDWRVFLAVAGVTILTGILSGLVPATRASSLRESEILKDDNRTGTSLHMGAFGKALVILQISVAAIILTLVVLFVKSVRNMMAVDYEYDADRVMTARIGLFEDVYPDPRDRANFLDSLLRNLRARPEIDFAATSHRYQFLGGPACQYEMPARSYANDSEREIARFQMISGDFFDTVGLPVQRGDRFVPEDFTAEVPRRAIINRAFAEREWPGVNPLGKRFRPDLGLPAQETDELPFVEVIGVTGGMQESGILERDEDGAAFFIPQVPAATPVFITVLVRGSGDPGALLPVLREEVRKMDNNLPLYGTGTPRQINDEMLAQFGFFSEIFTTFGALATFLGAIGIYGVITFSVNQRIMEFGIRQALGATRGRILKLVYSHAIKQIGTGFLIALLVLSPVILAPGIRESLAIFFYEIDPEEVTPYLLSFGFVLLIALAAATPPAIRAARIQPAQALRHE